MTLFFAIDGKTALASCVLITILCMVCFMEYLLLSVWLVPATVINLLLAIVGVIGEQTDLMLVTSLVNVLLLGYGVFHSIWCPGEWSESPSPTDVFVQMREVLKGIYWMVCKGKKAGQRREFRARYHTLKENHQDLPMCEVSLLSGGVAEPESNSNGSILSSTPTYFTSTSNSNFDACSFEDCPPSYDECLPPAYVDVVTNAGIL